MRWLHNLLKGASLTGALFVFQACYGTPEAPPFEELETTTTQVELPSSVVPDDPVLTPEDSDGEAMAPDASLTTPDTPGSGSVSD